MEPLRARPKLLGCIQNGLTLPPTSRLFFSFPCLFKTVLLCCSLTQQAAQHHQALSLTVQPWDGRKGKTHEFYLKTDWQDRKGRENAVIYSHITKMYNSVQRYSKEAAHNVVAHHQWLVPSQSLSRADPQPTPSVLLFITMPHSTGHPFGQLSWLRPSQLLVPLQLFQAGQCENQQVLDLV